MTKSEKTSLLLIGLGGGLLYLLYRGRVQPVQTMPGVPFGGGGQLTTIPTVIVDYFAGRSVWDVLAAPGPMFQREVLDYRTEGQNYPAP
jgi:hypothetical protein